MSGLSLSLSLSVSLSQTHSGNSREGGKIAKETEEPSFFIVAFVKRSLQIPKFKTIYDLVKAYDKTLVCKEL